MEDRIKNKIIGKIYDKNIRDQFGNPAFTEN